VQLFYLINGWAGRSEWLDGALRFFYVGAVPFLWTALAAFLIFAPRLRDGDVSVSRLRVAGASLLSLILCALVVWLVHLVQTQFLNGAPISPRPFMTHWVNALVVEPNDNTFPCFEVMLAAVGATLLWAVRPGAGVLAWLLVFVLGFARIFCGMNYPGDGVAGAFLGGAIGLVSLATLRVALQLPILKPSAQRLKWRVSHQAIFGGAALTSFLIFAVFTLTTTSPHASKFKPFWKTAPASAAPPANFKISQKLSTATLSGIHESEGGVLASEDTGPMSEPGKLLLSSRAARLDGHLPDAEIALTRALSTPAPGHRIIGVNVAQVRAGTSAYRCAAIRFEITKTGTEERRRVAETAALCVKRAFHADSRLQHVDVLGIDLSGKNADAPSLQEYSRSDDGGRDAKAQSAAPRHGVRVVFTASVERDDLIVKDKPAWVNWSGLDGGAWLRARSALYIDDEVLPAASPQNTEKIQSAKPKISPQKAVANPLLPRALAPQKPAASAKKRVAPRKRAVGKGSTRGRYRNQKKRAIRRSR
jgi:membrane-associated phospholipid phosphatase